MVFGRTGCDRWDVLNLEAPAEGEMTRRRRAAEEDKSLSLFKEHNYCQVIVREINVCAEDVLTLCEVSKGGRIESNRSPLAHMEEQNCHLLSCSLTL